MRAELSAACLLLGASASGAHAQPLPSSPGPIGAAVAEAAQNFGVPQAWIRAVMRRESGGDPRATSIKGAMGLMQLMPRTWAGLRAELGLGSDPYDVRDNVLAGAAYLRQLYSQFGEGGFLAAYNAGPQRYREFVERGRPLPAETRAYVAAVTRLIAGGPAWTATVQPAAKALPPSVFVRLESAFAADDSSRAGLFVSPAGK